MDECIDSHAEVALCIASDVNNAYWQVELKETDRDKTALTFHHELYRSVQIHCSLKNAPRTFERVTNVILSPVKWLFALVYLKNVVVF